jgi:hypothetical protein
MRYHRRDPPALRRALVRGRELSRLQHASGQPLAKQSQDSPIIDPRRDPLPQMAPGEMVEKATDLRIDSPVDVQPPALLTPLVQRLMVTVALPEAVGTFMQGMSKDGLSDPPHRPLDHRVLEAGVPSWPLLPLVLRTPYPLDWRRPIPIVAPPLMPGPQGGVQVLGVLRGRHRGHPRRTLFAAQTRGFQKACTGDQVQHVVAHPLRRALGLLRHALAWHGDGWCSPRLSPRSFQKHVMPGFSCPPVGPWGRRVPTFPTRHAGLPACGTMLRSDCHEPVSGSFGSPAPHPLPCSTPLSLGPLTTKGSWERLERPLNAGSLSLSGRHSSA